MRTTLFVGILALGFLVIACSEPSDDLTPSGNAPDNHTVINDGIPHKPGLNEPLLNCVTCHGDDLQGGITGVGCYDCHGKEWN